MARPKKDGTYLNVRIESDIYNQLEEMCEKSGLSKTVVVERALRAYINAYQKQQEKLKALAFEYEFEG